MKKILILLFTLAICQGNLFGQTDNNTSNRFLKAQYFGKVGGNTGSIIFTGTTSGNVTLKSADIAGTWSLTLPSTAGTANYPLLTNGSGVTSWGVLPVAGGGTNISSYAIGDIIYASGATTLSKLPIGTASQQLRVNAGATALEYFTPAANGITVGTTTITSGTTGSIGMNIGGIYSESISYRAQQATPFSTAFGFESHSSGSFSGVNNTSFGYQAGKGLTTGTSNLFVGYQAGITTTTAASATVLGSGAQASTGSFCTWVGAGAGRGISNKTNTIGIGYDAGLYNSNSSIYIGNSTGNVTGFGGDYQIVIGHSSDQAYASCIGIGYSQTNTGGWTATHQGILGSNNTNGYITDWYFNGTTHTAPYSVVLNASGGSAANGASMTINGGAGGGTDKNGGTLNLNGGTSSGAGTGGSIVLSTAGTAGTGTGVNAVTPRLTITTTGSINIPNTIDVTSGDAATIDKVAGRFRKDNSGTTFTLTNSLVTANSIILVTAANAAMDATAVSWTVSAGAGSFVVTFVAAPTADFNMNFLVIN